MPPVLPPTPPAIPLKKKPAYILMLQKQEDQDPIQVHENHSGPKPVDVTLPNGSVIRGSLYYKFVAYHDAERDVSCYGYGGTEEEAIADHLRQVCEKLCSECNECPTSTFCILTLPKLKHLLKREIDAYEANSTHGQWRALNIPEDEGGF